MAMAVKGEATAWCVRFKQQAPSTLRLICFPHAGGGAAAFHPLARLMPPNVETLAIVPPGREARLREAPLKSIAAMAEGAASAIAALPALPFAFFGHSMGAIIAFEVARLLQRQCLTPPRRLFISGRRAPCEAMVEQPLSQLDDATLVAEVSRRYEGIPATVLADTELLRMFLPVLRADMCAVESYVDMPQPALQVPLTLMGGLTDPQCTDAAWAGWHSLVAGPVEKMRFPGGHFYLVQERTATAAAIARQLAL
ncbi:thioesterase [Siccirubricoccus deserti]|uniref:Thioesterase n=1 Tax=Siccirubricoccus deserti TaxID=2013562 RepID=A0A9X0QZZ8_9PROT|nr:alpha/beta fold hydrolase [Siccirubricoccus deserti]MBC4017189.1 thioesterase [Siccirubricoccus deserti]GGC57425.1 thioesterase [Siccirubricoccus deserti]